MTQLSFPPAYRLLQAQGFSFVFAHKKSLRSEHFQLSYCPGQSQTARLGVVVAKKLARRAVARNRVKRQSREVFRHCRPGLPALDVVLRLTRPLPAAAWKEVKKQIRGEIETLFARLPR